VFHSIDYIPAADNRCRIIALISPTGGALPVPHRNMTMRTEGLNDRRRACHVEISADDAASIMGYPTRPGHDRFAPRDIRPSESIAQSGSGNGFFPFHYAKAAGQPPDPPPSIDLAASEFKVCAVKLSAKAA